MTLDLDFTTEAKELMLSFLEGITEYQPTLTLMKGHPNRESEEHWYYGAYAPQNLKAIAPELENLGYPLLYSCSGITIAIPQFHLIPELIGKTFALGPKWLVLQERKNGI